MRHELTERVGRIHALAFRHDRGRGASLVAGVERRVHANLNVLCQQPRRLRFFHHTNRFEVSPSKHLERSL